MLMGRKLQEILPTHYTQQTKPAYRDLPTERQKQKQKKCSTSTPESFKTNQQVAIQHYATKEWSLKGTIIEKVAPRSYTVYIYIYN